MFYSLIPYSATHILGVLVNYSCPNLYKNVITSTSSNASTLFYSLQKPPFWGLLNNSVLFKLHATAYLLHLAAYNSRLMVRH